MNMRHSWITALAAAPVLALPLGPAAAAPATAASPASGRVTCPIAAGTGTLSPGLTSAGSLGGSARGTGWPMLPTITGIQRVQR